MLCLIGGSSFKVQDGARDFVHDRQHHRSLLAIQASSSLSSSARRSSRLARKFISDRLSLSTRLTRIPL
jgi:hypothetical protein